MAVVVPVAEDMVGAGADEAKRDDQQIDLIDQFGGEVVLGSPFLCEMISSDQADAND